MFDSERLEEVREKRIDGRRVHRRRRFLRCTPLNDDCTVVELSYTARRTVQGEPELSGNSGTNALESFLLLR